MVGKSYYSKKTSKGSSKGSSIASVGATIANRKETPRNTGGSDNSRYNVDIDPSVAQAMQAAAEAKKRSDDAAAAKNRDDNRGTGNTAGGNTAAADDDDKDKDKKRKQVKTPKDLLELLELQSKGQAELTQKELTRIANFIAANKKNTNVLDEEKYPGIESIFQNVFDEDRLEDMIKGYREGYPDYFKGAIPGTGAVVMGMGDSLAAGKERPDGSDTLSGLKNKLTSSEIAYLKANRPDLYYAGSSSKGIGTPGLGGNTMNDLLELSQLDTAGLSGRQLQDIYAAREKINNQKEAYDARQPGLGGSMAPPPPPPPDPDPMIPVVPIPAPGTTTPIPTPKYPGSVVNDYTNMGIPNIYGNQQIPTYGYANYNQTGQPVGLQSYLDNLRKRFGIG